LIAPLDVPPRWRDVFEAGQNQIADPHERAAFFRVQGIPDQVVSQLRREWARDLKALRAVGRAPCDREPTS